MKRVAFAALAALTALSGAAYANPGKGWGGGNIPPGQLKKMQRHHHVEREVHIPRERVYVERDVAPTRTYVVGDRLPSGYRVIDDYRAFGLPNPGDGYRYARYDNEVYKVVAQTAAIASTIGLVSEILN